MIVKTMHKNWNSKIVIATLILKSLALSVNTITLLSQAQVGTTLSVNVTASAIYLTEYE